MKTKKIVLEFNALNTKDKLNFKCNGRPGISIVREAQAKLLNKKSDLRYKIVQNLKSSFAYKIYPRASREEYYSHDHTIRYDKYVLVEREKMREKELELAKAIDKKTGRIRELFYLGMLTKDLPKKIGDWYFQSVEEVDEDWDYYSKSWHNSYGPKKTTDRYVIFKKWDKKKRIEMKVNVNSFERGDWLAKAVVDAGIVDKKIKSKFNLKIRLKSCYDANFIKEKRGFKFYERTLAAAVIDYVVESPCGTIYHDANRENLISGIQKKILAKIDSLEIPGSKLISLDLVKKLGFCEQGINEFCEIYGLNKLKKYSAEQIAERLRTNFNAAKPFLNELKTLAEKLDYNFSM